MNQVNELLRAIGAAGRNEDGSYTRGCYSPEYFQAVDLVKEQMQALGMSTNLDAAGNLRGCLPGAQAGAKSILLGSHLDTVPCGGLYDGAYGVAGGLEVVRRLREEGRTLRHPLELYGFNGEESNPLGGTFGSRAVAGLISPEQPGLDRALEEHGRTLEQIMACRRDFRDAKCYLELHIEQGDYLDQEQLNIGVVSGIVGIIRYHVVALGRSNHAGTTRMKNRSDAMVAMSRLIVETDRRCREIDDALVFTAGTIQCWPGSENVIPGKVACTFEMRHMDQEKTDALYQAIQEAAAAIPTVRFEITKMIDKGPVPCDRHLMQVIQSAAAVLGLRSAVLPSGAGHDANPMAHRLPIGMIFVPSREGLSHCGQEYTSPQALEEGADVLYRTVLALDQED